MKKLILSLALIVGIAISTNAQNAKGDWYVGTGDVANVAWTDWAISPTLGYSVSDQLMVGLGLSQLDSSVETDVNIHARYFFSVLKQDVFAYASISEFEFDNVSLGLGKMFTIHKVVFVEPKIVYNVGEETTNLMLGFGLKF
jgi:hypothetical protein|tara:strand:- start:5992 stop:6417 length:426 start_codon:yes stop_codon:yes gene_type:complete